MGAVMHQICCMHPRTPGLRGVQSMSSQHLPSSLSTDCCPEPCGHCRLLVANMNQMYLQLMSLRVRLQASHKVSKTAWAGLRGC